MGEVKIIVDGILISIEFLRQIFVDGLTLGNIFDKMGDFLMTLILPGVGGAPVRIEIVLHLSHLLASSLLSIFLHASIDGGVDLQTLSI